MSLEKLTEKEIKNRTDKADALSNLSFSLVVGTVVDYFTGLNGFEMVTNRVFNAAAAAGSAPFYGRIREYFYKLTNTTTDHGVWRKFGVELAAFNTLPTTAYGGTLIVSQTLTKLFLDPKNIIQSVNDSVDAYNSLNNVEYAAATFLTSMCKNANTDALTSEFFSEVLTTAWEGYLTVTAASPVYCLAMPWWNDLVRKWSGLKTPAEKVSEYINTS